MPGKPGRGQRVSLAGIAMEKRPLEAPGRGGLWSSVRALISGSFRVSRGARRAYAAPEHRALASRTDAGDDGGVPLGTHAEAQSGHSPGERRHEDAAFDAFFQRHEQPLYGFLRRILPSHEVAVEVAQEAFFRAWTHFAEVRAYERPEAWLYRVATNLAISHLRRRHPLSFTQVFRRAGDGEESDGNGDSGEALADPLDMEGDAAARDLINRVLSRLPERQRAALLLRALHGFSGEEIAEMLDISVANARQILSRGRERFRQLYEEAAREGDEAK
ncbi:MAG: RNA polymerase sigma factor [Ktedonobacterales bacterium]